MKDKISSIKYIPKICPECGDVFRKNKKWSYSMWNSKKYCSNLCASKNRVKKIFVNETKKCIVCGDLFHKTQHNKYTWNTRDKCSYGCPQIKNVSGQKFGKLTALYLSQKKPVKWTCLCDCGTETEVAFSHLSSGHTKSCGCYTNHHKTHGLRFTREYAIWNSMIQRCNNNKIISYKYYGGRGIVVCEKWLKFENFYEDMGARPTEEHQIDRKNNDGDYKPSNCRWATRTEQARNKSTNVFLEYRDESMTVVEWSEKLNIPAKRIYSRIHLGMPTKKVLSKEIFNNGFK